ncbi:MAG: Gfo/Idh/MocA family oxidoreductase [Chloroflexota bacterium]|nr:Gfo/Idh/MocA family oxidoreductase [Chloroflexota bacterium]
MTVKIAIIGCGAVAEKIHLPEYARSEEAEIIACVDIVREKAQRLAERVGGAQVYTDYRDALALDEVQAVDICLPNYLHAPVAIAAAEAGKHVLCEKPMTISMADAQSMIDAAKEAGVTLMIRQSTRFVPPYSRVKQIVDSGVLGKINTIRGVHCHGGPEHWTPNYEWFFTKAKSGGGAMLDMGIHICDFILWLLDREVVEVTGFAGTLEKDIEVDDNGMTLMRFDDNTFAFFQASWSVKPMGDSSLTIHGEKGVLRLRRDPKHPIALELQTEGGTPDIQYPEVKTPGAWGTACGHFAECVAQGKEPMVTGEDGKRALEIILATFKSSQTGQTIRLPLEG